MDKHRPVIFYGAGAMAGLILPKFEAKGIFPKCFADADETKWHTKFYDTWGDYTNYDILPLKEAIELYPDYQLYITTHRSRFRSMTEYLINAGIPRGRICYAEPVEWRKGCPSLGIVLTLDENIGVCYSAFFKHKEGVKEAVDTSKSPEEIFAVFDSLVDRRIEDLRDGRPTSCDSCRYLEFDYWSSEPPQIKNLTFNSVQGEDFCAFKCSYCRHYPKPEPEVSQRRFQKIIEMIDYFAGISSEGIVSFGNGEITVTYSEEQLALLFDTLRKYSLSGNVFSNAPVFSESLAYALGEGIVSLTVSVDSGTPETFAKIKGVDCFNVVVGNLKKYAAVKGKGSFTLNYIILTDVNDNETEINKFLDIAENLTLSASVSNVMDYEFGNEPKSMTKNGINAVFSFIKKCNERNIPFSTMDISFTPEDFKRIKEFEASLN